MFELFLKGGPIMYVLLFCSLAGLYIVVNKFFYLKLNSVHPELILERVKNQLLTSGKKQTMQNLQRERQLMLRVLAQGIRFSGQAKQDIQDNIKGITCQEVPKLEKDMNLLSSIITVAPILGLLGTVLGLIDIFNVISGGGLGDAAALSGGIAQALITTVTGLTIAIPFIFLYQYLSHKIEIFLVNTEHLLNEVLIFCKKEEVKL